MNTCPEYGDINMYVLLQEKVTSKRRYFWRDVFKLLNFLKINARQQRHNIRKSVKCESDSQQR